MGTGSNSTLSVVGDDAPPASSPRPLLSDDRLEMRRRPWEARVRVGILVFMLAAASFLAVLEYRRAESLAEVNGSLRAKLGEVRGQLSAHRAHLADVRLGVTDLSARFDQLRGLVNREPAPAQGVQVSSGQMPGVPPSRASGSPIESLPDTR